jgi:hypothetical protein
LRITTRESSEKGERRGTGKVREKEKNKNDGSEKEINKRLESGWWERKKERKRERKKERTREEGKERERKRERRKEREKECKLQRVKNQERFYCSTHWNKNQCNVEATNNGRADWFWQ